MYRFALSRRWMIGHVLVLLTIAGCVTAARWQLHRLEEKRAHNRIVSARLAQEILPLERAVAAAPGASREAERDASRVVYRRVEGRGRFDPAHEVILFGRALEGRPGNHVLTPLVTGPGVAVLVDRGWVPIELDRAPVGQARPPAGEVRVRGIVVPLDEPVEEPSYRTPPFALLLASQEPEQTGELPRPAPLVQPGEGPHLNYAVQWSIFAAVAAIGWIALLRHTAREVAGARARGRSRTRPRGSGARP